jgi:hypothetical protein
LVRIHGDPSSSVSIGRALIALRSSTLISKNDPFNALFNKSSLNNRRKKTECPEGRIAATYMHASFSFHAAALVSKQEKRERVILETNKNRKGAGEKKK